MQSDETLHVDGCGIANARHATRRGRIVRILNGRNDSITRPGRKQHLGRAGGETYDPQRHSRQSDRAPEIILYRDGSLGGSRKANRQKY